jgi:hypothetical protein
MLGNGKNKQMRSGGGREGRKKNFEKIIEVFFSLACCHERGMQFLSLMQ